MKTQRPIKSSAGADIRIEEGQANGSFRTASFTPNGVSVSKISDTYESSASLAKRKHKATYRNKKWIDFRDEVITLDGGRCRRCPRSEADGEVLQVHHLQYYPGTPIWKYPLKDVLTLCMGCHAREHGIIRPSSGWHLVADEVLDERSGICNLCGTSIRFLFHIDHPNWEGMTVGTYCCDNLTETKEASQNVRRQNFVNSAKWRIEADGYHIVQSRMHFRIDEENGAFRVYVQGRRAKETHASLEIAKSTILRVLDDGTVLKALEERRIPLEPPSRKVQKRLEVVEADWQSAIDAIVRT